MKLNKIIKTACFFLVISGLLTGCSKFDELNTDPDEPTTATPSLMATEVIWDMAAPGHSTSKVFSYDYLISKYIGWAEGALDEQYNKFGRASFGGYTILTTAKKMVEVAEASGSPQYESYLGLYEFLKAFKLFGLTMRMGDIPYSEALRSEEGIMKPKYDTQKEVFLHILEDLDKAYQHFGAASEPFDGDMIYDGNNQMWQKMVSAFQMRVLLALSKKESDADLNIKQRFQNIVTNQVMMSSNADNFQLEFKNQAGMVYPFHTSQSQHSQYVLMSEFFMSMMKAHEDYRMFYYAAPADYMVSTQGLPRDSWDAFQGVKVTLPFNEMGTIASEGKCSRLNHRFLELEEGIPFAKMRYSDVQFYMAEAALRGWIAGNPNDYYLEAIRADLKFKQVNMVDDETYNYGRVITDQYIADFTARPDIQLQNDFEYKLKQIMTQKYISNFFQILELQAYFDYRRTGYPEFPINPQTNQNIVTDQMPQRYMYPTSERNYNSANLQEALQRQYDGQDKVNDVMWILK